MRRAGVSLSKGLRPFASPQEPGVLAKKRSVSLSVRDAGCHTFSAGVPPASTGWAPSFAIAIGAPALFYSGSGSYN